MSKTLKQKLVAYALVLPAFLVVMLTVAYPIVSAVIQSFQDEKTGAFTLDNYAYFFTEPAQRMNILYTLFVVIATVVIALVVAYLLALYLRFVHSGIAKSIGTLYLLPRFVPAMCAVYAMITIIRDSGLINRIGLHFGMDSQARPDVPRKRHDHHEPLVQHSVCGNDDHRRSGRDPGQHHRGCS